MSIDFFKTKCTETAKTDEIFGICDDQNGSKAYTDTTDDSNWIAIVKNDNKIEIAFTAIDNCITVYKEGSKDKESTCDGMLTFIDNIFLMELKKQGTGGWISYAISQLENTIKILMSNHDLYGFKYKKAFACNKKHPNFHFIDNEMNKSFYNKYGFRIDIQNEIVIK